MPWKRAPGSVQWLEGRGPVEAFETRDLGLFPRRRAELQTYPDRCRSFDTEREREGMKYNNVKRFSVRPVASFLNSTL